MGQVKDMMTERERWWICKGIWGARVRSARRAGAAMAVVLVVLSPTTVATVAHSSTSPVQSDSGSVSPTLVASLPGSPLSLEIISEIDFIIDRKRRPIDVLPHTRPLKLARHSIAAPATDHDLRPMRYNHQGSSGDSNGIATNGHSKPSSIVQPPWPTLYEDSPHDREQVVRTLLQALRDVGYT